MHNEMLLTGLIQRKHDFAKIILADLTEYLEYLHLWLYFNKLTDKLKVWNFHFNRNID